MKIFTTCISKNKFFEQTEVKNENLPSSYENFIINVYDDVEYQKILGFGGAFTESSAYNYAKMSERNKKLVIDAYFSEKYGIAYNFGRTHINSCDFGIEPYTYVTDDDKGLKTFDISRERKYVLPFIKDACKVSGEGITLFASPWSPPAFMKDNNNIFKGGKLLDEYKESWAHYYAKYILAMRNEGVNICAISVQNEPIAVQPWESCYYTPEDEAEFIDKYLAPALDNEGLSDIKIIIWDHNKERVYDRAKKILKKQSIKERVFAVGYHWYSGEHHDGVKLVNEVLKKPTILTEFCCGINSNPLEIAEKYAVEISQSLNNHTIAVCDWNLILNSYGGPYHNRNRRENAPAFDIDHGCYAPILYHEDTDTVELTPCYYYIGHFSKFVKKSAVRVATTKYDADIFATAFKNPDGEKVLVLINTASEDKTAVVRNNDACTQITLTAHSISTVLF